MVLVWYCSLYNGLLCFAIAGIVSLTLNTIEVPPHKVVGDKAVLICQFDMEGDTLYSVKWYKDDREFYRFVPNDRPRLQVFDTEGIQVDVSTKHMYDCITDTYGLGSLVRSRNKTPDSSAIIDSKIFLEVQI